MSLSWRGRLGILVAIVTLMVLAAVGLMWSQQRHVLYPGSGPAGDTWTNLPEGYRTVALVTSDRIWLKALYRPSAPGKRTILFFHGNGDTVRGAARIVEPLVAAGYGAFLAEFRGYAGNPGTPSEQGLYHDGDAAWAEMVSLGIAPDRTIVAGYSLGTGIASRLAANHRPAALVMISPFTSVEDAAAQHFGAWVRPLVSDRYPTNEHFARIDAPVMLLHGAADRTVFPSNSVDLHRLNPKADLFVVPGEGHVFAFDPRAGEMIRTWLAAKKL